MVLWLLNAFLFKTSKSTSLLKRASAAGNFLPKKKKFLCAQKTASQMRKYCGKPTPPFFANECDLAGNINGPPAPWCHHKVKWYFGRFSMTNSSLVLLVYHQNTKSKCQARWRAGRVFAKSFCNKNESYIWSSWKHQHLSNKNSFAAAEAHSLHFLTSNARGYENARERVLLHMK